MPSILDEFCTAQLGDKRRVERLLDVVEVLRDAPDESFPNAFKGDKAGLKGLYRFLSTPDVTLAAELEGHVQASWQRAQALGQCFAIHDTTELVFSTIDEELTRQGLEKASKHTQRLRMHPTLLVASDGSRIPLGLAAMMTWARTDEDRAGRPEKWCEKQRWLEQALVVEDLAPESVDLIHLMDRDADCYDLLDGLVSRRARFVVRLLHNRPVVDPTQGYIKEALEQVHARGERVIEVSKRGSNRSANHKKKHPPRPARQATVAVRATTVAIKRSHNASPKAAQTLDVNVVEVVEIEPPVGEEPMSWYLLTSEAVATEKDCWSVVDSYCARWTIEEYFKTLKSGCKVEDRQLKSRHAIEAMLGIMVPLAWRMLLMRNLAEMTPDAPATTVFAPTELDVLRAAKPKMLSESPSLAQAFYAVAALGGHLSGRPGWLTLWRGFKCLGQRHEGYLLGLEGTSDSQPGRVSS